MPAEMSTPTRTSWVLPSTVPRARPSQASEAWETSNVRSISTVRPVPRAVTVSVALRPERSVARPRRASSSGTGFCTRVRLPPTVVRDSSRGMLISPRQSPVGRE